MVGDLDEPHWCYLVGERRSIRKMEAQGNDKHPRAAQQDASVERG